MKPHDGATYRTGAMERLNGIKSRSRILLGLQAILKRVGFAILFLGVALLSFADTTWVSGQIEGIWNESGSPYIVIDSSWVQDESELQVQGGTSIIIESPDGKLQLSGICRFQGTREDSISICINEPSDALFSFRQNTESVRMSFTSIEGLGYFYLEADSISFDHCNINSLHDINGGWYDALVASSVTIDSSIMGFVWCFEADATIKNSTYSGAIYLSFGPASLDSLVFIGDESVGNGIVSLSSWDSDDDYEISNSIVDVLYADLRNCAACTIALDNVAVQQLADIQAPTATVTNSAMRWIRIDLNSNSTITHNLFGMIQVGTSVSIEISNNTFIQLHGCWNGLPGYFISASANGTEIVNNIFVTDHPEVTVLNAGFSPSSLPSYNLTYGMNDPWGSAELGPGNIDSLPLFDPSDSLFRLTFDSPARNGGDPARLDPDGSQSDIGARWWDHSYDHPPIILLPDTVRPRWGDAFNLNIPISDESATTVEILNELPDWTAAGFVPFGSEPFEMQIRVTDNHGQIDQACILFDILPYSTLSDTIRGRLTIEYSPYQVLHDVFVPSQDTLTIDPGVIIEFETRDCVPNLIVEGVLLANGNSGDSVRFENLDDLAPPWGSVRFLDEEAVAQLTFCRFSNTTHGISGFHNGRVEVSHSTLLGTGGLGASVLTFWQSNDSIIVQQCDMVSNAVCSFDQCNFFVDACTFIGSEESSPKVRAWRSSGMVQRSRFVNCNDIAVSFDSGIYRLERCVFDESIAPLLSVSNNADPMSTSVTIRHNTIVNDLGHFATIIRSAGLDFHVAIENNVIVSGDSYAFRLGSQVDSTYISINNNCLSGIDSVLGFSPAWPTIGINSRVNINGDSTDLYGDLVTDPLLSEESLVLLPGSPCVDAGIDIGQEYFGLAPDMGFLEFDGTSVGNGREMASKLSASIFPNPANSDVRFTVSGLLGPTNELRMFNSLGQVVFSERIMTQYPFSSGTIRLAEMGIATGKYFVVFSDGREKGVVPLTYLK